MHLCAINNRIFRNHSPTSRRLPTYVVSIIFRKYSSHHTSRRSFRENKNEWNRTKTHCGSVSSIPHKDKKDQWTWNSLIFSGCGDGIWTSWPPGYENICPGMNFQHSRIKEAGVFCVRRRLVDAWCWRWFDKSAYPLIHIATLYPDSVPSSGMLSFFVPPLFPASPNFRKFSPFS